MQAAQLVRKVRPKRTCKPFPARKPCGWNWRWPPSTEAVQHLDDLLLRRTRLGILLPHGGLDHLPRIRQRCVSRTCSGARRAGTRNWRATATDRPALPTAIPGNSQILAHIQ
jgi:hypothetical protein